MGEVKDRGGKSEEAFSVIILWGIVAGDASNFQDILQTRTALPRLLLDYNAEIGTLHCSNCIILFTFLFNMVSRKN
ncbi:MAG: hypothetical protein D3914_01795 [Candidatus Electrothrix sp. LOE2]|nr:hypothetical protein [Candidatus Electrothrix sp. LOE2]